MYVVLNYNDNVFSPKHDLRHLRGEPATFLFCTLTSRNTQKYLHPLFHSNFGRKMAIIRQNISICFDLVLAFAQEGEQKYKSNSFFPHKIYSVGASIFCI
jgi:hypothetical protein